MSTENSLGNQSMFVSLQSVVSSFKLIAILVLVQKGTMIFTVLTSEEVNLHLFVIEAFPCFAGCQLCHLG